MIRENGLGKPIFKDVERQILLSFQVCLEAYQRDRSLIPEGNLHELRFEDLEQNPVAELRAVYETLQLPGFDQLEEILRPQEADLKKYRKNEFKEDPEWTARVTEMIAQVERQAKKLSACECTSVPTSSRLEAGC